MPGARRELTMSAGEARWEGRRQARDAAVRLLYQMDVAGSSAAQALEVLKQVGSPEGAELEADIEQLALGLADGAWHQRVTLDSYIADASRNWRLERLTTIDRLVMRLAVYELTAHRNTPPLVVMDEAIELARRYSGEDSARFVNGVLDGVLRRLKEEGKVVD